jgi:hypothetical protein
MRARRGQVTFRPNRAQDRARQQLRHTTTPRDAKGADAPGVAAGSQARRAPDHALRRARLPPMVHRRQRHPAPLVRRATYHDVRRAAHCAQYSAPHTAEPRSQRLIRSGRTPVESEKGLLRCVLCCFPRSRQTVHNPVDHRIMAHEQIVERRLITPPEPFEGASGRFRAPPYAVACP